MRASLKSCRLAWLRHSPGICYIITAAQRLSAQHQHAEAPEDPSTRLQCRHSTSLLLTAMASAFYHATRASCSLPPFHYQTCNPLGTFSLAPVIQGCPVLEADVAADVDACRTASAVAEGGSAIPAAHGPAEQDGCTLQDSAILERALHQSLRSTSIPHYAAGLPVLSHKEAQLFLQRMAQLNRTGNLEVMRDVWESVYLDLLHRLCSSDSPVQPQPSQQV